MNEIDVMITKNELYFATHSHFFNESYFLNSLQM